MPRRRYHRISVDRPATVRRDGKETKGSFHSLGRGGVLIHTHRLPGKPGPLDLELDIGTKEPFRATGSVVWSHADESRDGTWIGIEFIAMSPSELRRLQTFLVGRLEKNPLVRMIKWVALQGIGLIAALGGLLIGTMLPFRSKIDCTFFPVCYMQDFTTAAGWLPALVTAILLSELISMTIVRLFLPNYWLDHLLLLVCRDEDAYSHEKSEQKEHHLHTIPKTATPSDQITKRIRSYYRLIQLASLLLVVLAIWLLGSIPRAFLDN